MEIEQFIITQKEAGELWKQYRDACKDNPKDSFLSDMKAVYNQIKNGRKIIDIDEVMRRGGLNMKLEPRLAVCPADSKVCFLEYHENGRVKFSDDQSWKTKTDDVIIENVFPRFTEDQKKQHYSKISVKTSVPVVPVRFRPKGELGSYHILWEVDEWKIIPPRDPYLLRRINKNIFVVLAGWNLSELERAVMKGRLHP